MSRRKITPGNYRREKDDQIYRVRNEVQQPGYADDDAATYVVVEDEKGKCHLFCPSDFLGEGIERFTRVV